jgi:tRNA threonylcarbamoyladenosine biosynthesis protein TsaB
MISLAIDTSAHLCAAAVHDSEHDAILSEATEEIGRGHAERLMDVISAVLTAAGKDYSALGRVIATTGPGSFTGIRVGLATARGIGLGLDIEVCGVGTLEAAAFEARRLAPQSKGRPLLACFDARRGEAYCQFFDAPGAPEGPPEGPFVASYHEIPSLMASRRDWSLCGSGADAVNSAAGTAFPVLHGLAAIPIASVARLGAAKPSPTGKPEPLYLRAPDAKPQEGFILRRA